VLRQQLPRNDPRLAQALVALAASLHGTRWRDEILPALQEAERILDARGDRNSELRGRLLVRLAQRHQNLSTPKMLAFAAEAVAVLEKQSNVNFGELSTALHLLARAHVLQGEPRRADGLYERALQAQQRIEPPSQVALAQTRVARGEGLIAQGCFRDAAEWLQAALTQAEAALGASDMVALILGSRLAVALHASGQREEARALHATTVRQALTIKGEDDTLLVPLTRMDWARSLHAEGAFEEALALAEQVNAVNRRHYHGSVVLGGGLFMEGQLQGLLGDFDRAAALFDEGESHWRRGMAGGGAPWRFNRMLFDRARLALARRNAEMAQTLLSQVVVPPPGTVTLPTDEVDRALIGVRAHALTGAGPAALALLQNAADRIAATGMAQQRPAWQAELDLARAQALLTVGDAPGAEVAAHAAAAWRQANDPPWSPWTAEAETTWAEALRRAGRVEESRAVAVQARERLGRHSRLGPQFTEPAQRLRAALEGDAV
jgi:tetratricopeptide (TPR) repeat protein